MHAFKGNRSKRIWMFSTKAAPISLELIFGSAHTNASKLTGLNDKEKDPSHPEEDAASLNAIEVYGLRKNFGGSKGCCGRSLICSGAYDCCSCRAAKR